MRKTDIAYLFRLILTLAILFLFSCKNDPSSEHNDALPHNKMMEGDELSEHDAERLAGADGKSAHTITTVELKKLVQDDTATVLIIHFWKHDCTQCSNMQQQLQSIQQRQPKGKMRLISLNLDPQKDVENVDLAIRKGGFSRETYQLLDQGDLSSTGLVPGWNGQFPAIAVVVKGEPQAFYQQYFSENELLAVLNPFLL